MQFFDRQFERQIAEGEFVLNPFERAALPHLRARVLDFGCGLGNLSLAAARQGCSVLALDASAAAIGHLRAVARAEGLPIEARAADLRAYPLTEDFDAVVCIGLLMFFDCASADAQLAQLQARVRPGGVAAVNVLVQGTTFLDMFTEMAPCLWPPDELRRRFAGWNVLLDERQDFAVPDGRVKSFATVVARRPGVA